MSTKSGALSATGAGAPFGPAPGVFNAGVGGTFVGTIQLERQLPGDTTWCPVARDVTGTILALTTPASLTLSEQQTGVAYRWNVTAYTSGSIAWNFGQ